MHRLHFCFLKLSIFKSSNFYSVMIKQLILINLKLIAMYKTEGCTVEKFIIIIFTVIWNNILKLFWYAIYVLAVNIGGWSWIFAYWYIAKSILMTAKVAFGKNNALIFTFVNRQRQVLLQSLSTCSWRGHESRTNKLQCYTFADQYV